MNIKAVIDTNVFVSAFWSKNIEAPPRRIYLAAQDDFAKLVTGNAKHYPPAPFVVTPAEFTKFIA